MKRRTIALLVASCVSLAPLGARAEPPATPPAAPTAPASPVGAGVTDVASNASFTAAITFADGRTHAGKVIRVERGEDFWAEEGWTDEKAKLTVSLESGSALKDVRWEDFSLVTIKYLERSEINCQYDSNFTPWMHICDLRTDTQIKTRDGQTWTTSSRYKWRFTFSDGSTEEFWLYKLPARREDPTDAWHEGNENYNLYGDLQQEIMQASKKAVTRIVIQ
jgi:hypothetical protein